MDVQLASLFASGAFIIIGLFAAIFIDNLIKKIIGIAFIEEGVNLFLICLGFKAGGVVPIFLPGMTADWFAANAAYPLPQALVLTSIVIGASTLAVMLALAMVLYRKHLQLSASNTSVVTTQPFLQAHFHQTWSALLWQATILVLFMSLKILKGFSYSLWASLHSWQY